MTDLVFTSSDSVLNIDDLPPRAQTLSPDQMADVFGGCGRYGDSCDGDCDCCTAFKYYCYDGECTR